MILWSLAVSFVPSNSSQNLRKLLRCLFITTLLNSLSLSQEQQESQCLPPEEKHPTLAYLPVSFFFLGILCFFRLLYLLSLNQFTLYIPEVNDTWRNIRASTIWCGFTSHPSVNEILFLRACSTIDLKLLEIGRLCLPDIYWCNKTVVKTRSHALFNKNTEPWSASSTPN